MITVLNESKYAPIMLISIQEKGRPFVALFGIDYSLFTLLCVYQLTCLKLPPSQTGFWLFQQISSRCYSLALLR